MNRFCFTLCLVVGWQMASAQPLTPAQIFAKTVAVYESAATYQDTGEVLRYTKDHDGVWFMPDEYKDTITFGLLLSGKPVNGDSNFRSQKQITQRLPVT